MGTSGSGQPRNGPAANAEFLTLAAVLVISENPPRMPS